MGKMILFLAAGLSVAVSAQAYTIKNLTAKGAKNKYCDYDVTVPQLVADPGEDAQAFARLNAKWRSDSASDIKTYREAVADTESCRDDLGGYNVSRKYEVKERNGRLLSLVFTESVYSGGAHPNWGLSAEVADVVTGETFPKLSAFVDDAKVPVLTRLIEAQLPKIDENFDATFGWNDWKKSHRHASEVENFYFSAKGLTVIFNPYEIGSFAEGALEPAISWEQLRRNGLLRTSGPATFLIQQ